MFVLISISSRHIPNEISIQHDGREEMVWSVRGGVLAH